MANKRLIDATKLLNKYNLYCKTAQERYIALIKAPTVDAVEVVRCKDCKWYAPNNNGLWYGCAFDTRNKDDEPKADDFCSCGERRKERGTMRQSRARRERQERLQLYEYQLHIWEMSKPAWWRIFARMKWKASRPKYVRR